MVYRSRFFKNRKCNIDVRRTVTSTIAVRTMSDFYRPITKYETDGETMRKRVQLENWFSPGRASSILRIKYYRNLTLPLLPCTVHRFSICCIHARHARVPASSHLSAFVLTWLQIFRDKHALNFIITIIIFLFLFFFNLYRDSESNSFVLIVLFCINSFIPKKYKKYTIARRRLFK